MKSVLNIQWKDWCCIWSTNTLAIWWEELTHWKRPWCWERLKVGREGDDRGWDGWMASLTQWTWVWVNSGSWWWTGRPGVLQSMGLQRFRHDWVTELNWTDPNPILFTFLTLTGSGISFIFVLVYLFNKCLQSLSQKVSAENGYVFQLGHLNMYGGVLLFLQWLPLLALKGSGMLNNL